MQKRRISVTKKLLFVLIPLLSVLVAFIIITCFMKTKDIMHESVLNQMENEARYNAKQIVSWKTGITEMLEAVQGTLENIQFASDSDELHFLEKTVDFNSSIPYGVYEGDADGIYLDGSGWVPEDDYVVTERDWYTEGLKCHEFTFGEPYIDANSGNFIVSASTMLNRPDKNKRVAAVDIFLDDITEQVAGIKVMNAESGYAFLVDTNSNVVLAHSDLSKNGMEMSVNDSNHFMAEIARNLGVSDLSIEKIDNQNTPYYVSFMPIEETNWLLVSCVAESDLFAGLRRLEVTYGIFSVIMIAIMAVVLGIIVQKTTSPIQVLTDKISSISDGDFTIDVQEKGNDEITTMSIALKNYIQKMRAVIGDITKISNRVDDKANTGNETAKLLNSAAMEQTESMKSMKESMEQLAIAVNEIAENATTLAQVVDGTNSHVADANEKMKTSVSVADEGYKNMKVVQDNMQNIVVSIEELAGVVENVGQSTGEINEIIQMIGEIAASTNLLALNASIEAARAGEAGRGFAVVADEISKLASSSANSVNQITEIIHKVNEQVDTMVSKTKGNVEIIENNSQLLDVAYDGFRSIYNDIAETSDILNSIMGEVSQVNDVASNMAAISEEQSASAELVTDTIEQIFMQSEHVAEESARVEETSTTLSEISKLLMEHMDEFKIKES